MRPKAYIVSVLSLPPGRLRAPPPLPPPVSPPLSPRGYCANRPPPVARPAALAAAPIAPLTALTQ